MKYQLAMDVPRESGNAAKTVVKVLVQVIMPGAMIQRRKPGSSLEGINPDGWDEPDKGEKTAADPLEQGENCLLISYLCFYIYKKT